MTEGIQGAGSGSSKRQFIARRSGIEFPLAVERGMPNLPIMIITTLPGSDQRARAMLQGFRHCPGRFSSAETVGRYLMNAINRFLEEG